VDIDVEVTPNAESSVCREIAKRSPWRAARRAALARKRSLPSEAMNWIAPPVQAGKPIPKIEPMFASATLLSTPSARQRAVSIDWR
jgi:hypothetical protein